MKQLDVKHCNLIAQTAIKIMKKSFTVALTWDIVLIYIYIYIYIYYIYITGMGMDLIKTLKYYDWLRNFGEYYSLHVQSDALLLAGA